MGSDIPNKKADFSSNTEVAVIRDVTQESDCKLEVSDNGGPFKQLKCPPGTVISVARATWDEVSNIENDVVVSLSGQQKRDDEQIDQAVDELVASIAPVAVQQANCNEKDRSVHGSYNIGGSYRVEYALKYHIKDSCEVRKIRDKHGQTPQQVKRHCGFDRARVAPNNAKTETPL